MSSGGAQNHQPDGLNLPRFASTEDDSLYSPPATDQGYYRFQNNPTEQQQLERLRQSASPQFHTSTLPPHSTTAWRESSPHHQSFNDFPLFPSTTDPNLFDYDSKDSVPSGSINPADLMNTSPPHQIHPSQPQQPTSQPGSTSLLSSPSSDPQASLEWDSVFSHPQSYRRAPSEYSDVSAHSPFLQNQEFTEHASPLLQSVHIQQGSMQDFLNAGASPGESFGLDQFTLNESDITPDVSPRISPAPLHSGANSPYMLPQNNHYLGYVPPMGPTRDMNNFQPPPPRRSADGLGLNRGGPADDGVFPQINVIFAPLQRQPTFPGKPGHTHDDSALSPPPKSALFLKLSQSIRC